MADYAEYCAVEKKKTLVITGFEQLSSAICCWVMEDQSLAWKGNLCFSDKLGIRPKTGFLAHNFGHRCASKSIKGSIGFEQLSSSIAWRVIGLQSSTRKVAHAGLKGLNKNDRFRKLFGFCSYATELWGCVNTVAYIKQGRKIVVAHSRRATKNLQCANILFFYFIFIFYTLWIL